MRTPVPAAAFKERQQRFRGSLKNHHVSVFVSTALPDIRYLTGFSGSAAMLAVSTGRTYFMTDFRYRDQAAAEVTADRIIIVKKTYREHLKKLNIIRRGSGVGFSSARMEHAPLTLLQQAFPGAVFTGLQDPLGPFRNVKDAAEIRLISRAMRITEQAFTAVLPLIKPGVREMEIAAELEYRMKLNGSDVPAFTTIVASGRRGALPHGVASEKKIRNRELVTMDFGATYRGYCGDFTRTVAVGRVSGKLRKAYEVVREAQAAALAAVTPGITGSDLDAVARKIIRKAGFGANFGHGLGHGLGLEIHEDIRISPGGTVTLVPGMVHSVEPGIYLPGTGGIRIEDVVAVTEKGCRNLTRTPTELLEL